MQSTQSVIPAGAWSDPPIDTITLDYEARHRRRVVLTTDGGCELLLDLAHAVQLRDGDALRTDAGLIHVRAAAEPLLELRAADARACVRLAWHVGNRHVPAQLGDNWLRVRPDPVLADLAVRLGADVVAICAAFDPEGGAYAAHAPDAERRVPLR